MSSKIFISYRRDDTASMALNIAQSLERTFGKGSVFIDVDGIQAGRDFGTILKNTLCKCKVVIAVIGPRWLEIKNEANQRRLDDPEDWVRQEISFAIKSNLIVVPTLVDGATLPKRQDLPLDLQELVMRNAVKITTNGFRHEMIGLANDIQPAIGRSLFGASYLAGSAFAISLVLAAVLVSSFSLDWLKSIRNSDQSNNIGAALSLDSGGSSMKGFFSNHDFDVDYVSSASKPVSIVPKVGYLEKVKSGLPLIASQKTQPFDVNFPRISIKSTNNTGATTLFDTLSIIVKKSKIDTTPIPIFVYDPWNVGNILLVNEGYGPIVNPTIKFGIFDCRDQGIERRPEDFSLSETLPQINDSFNFLVKNIVPSKLIREHTVCVSGILSYSTHVGKTLSNGFQTKVSLVMPGPGAAAPPSQEYDVFLEAGKENYTLDVPISQGLKAGDFDNFLIKIATNKSAEFELSVLIKTIGGREIRAGDMKLSFFVPRSVASDVMQLEQQKRRMASPWGETGVSVNNQIRQYSEVVRLLRDKNVPIDSEFGNEGDHPPMFVMSFGSDVPPKNVQLVIDILSHAGLEAIHVDDEFSKGRISVGTYWMRGVNLSSQLIEELEHLKDKPDKYYALIKKDQSVLVDSP